MTTTYTLIEYMPECHRASHKAAGNSGRWPVNGAVRVYVEGDVRESDLDPQWASVIEDGISELPDGETAIVASDLDADAWRPLPPDADEDDRG